MGINAAQTFGVSEPVGNDAGADDPNALNLANLPGSVPRPAGDGSEGGQPENKGEKLFLGRFKSEAEANQHLQSLESSHNALREQMGRDALIRSRSGNTAAPEVDEVEELLTKGADLFDADQLKYIKSLADAIQNKAVKPIKEKFVEDEADSQIREVRETYPDFMKYYDKAQALVARPGYQHIRLIDAFNLVIPPEERLRARSPADRNALKREAGHEGGGGLAALPVRGKASQKGDAQQLLDALGMGSTPNNAAQRRLFGVGD
jgi:hypothetical protein